jgi:DNA-binding CsgD family transcriptional regulator
VLTLMQQRLRYEDFGTATELAVGTVESAGSVTHEGGPLDVPARLGRLTEKSRRGALTHRENKMAMLSLSGLSSRAIADKLAISFETVRVHKNQTYAKLGVGSQSELFAMFYEPGRFDGE